MAYNKTEKSDRPDAPMKRRPIRRRKKVCVFCAEKNAVIDYKDTSLRDTSLKEVRFFLEELLVTVQSISVHLQLQSREQDT